MDQKNRNLIDTEGFISLSPGKVSGTIIGGNLCTLNLLQGTEYFPDLKDSLLFIDDDEESLPHNFDRDLQALIHLPGFSGVKGIVIGRFQKASRMDIELLEKIIESKKELHNLPILANVGFGHTDPKITFPIGGNAAMEMRHGKVKLEILKH
jgi:muramoyltetrapeptide carboxypeptidase LdcA involved in peptidoglycan recycling